MKNKSATPISSHFQRGLKLHQNGQLDAAIVAYARAIKQEPSDIGSYINMGSALRSLGKFDAARLSYQRAIALSDNDASLLSNYGNLLCDMSLHDEAEKVHQDVLQLEKDNPGYLYNAAIVPFSDNRPQQAIELFDQVIDKEADHVNAHWNRALAYLQMGELKKGFTDYEWRLKLDRVEAREFDQPRWEKGSLKGKRILLSAEQGFGDMLQFLRFIPLIAEKAKTVIVECRPELHRIVEGIDGVDEVVRLGDALPDYDVYLPLLSIPYKLKTTLDTLPATFPYINVEASEKNRLPASQHKRLRVGLIWSGKTTPRDRSCELENFLPLMQNSNVTFYSFQLGPRREDISNLGADAFIYDMAGSIRDFADTAALMQHMDLIITIDTAAAHLAGALGLPSWVLLLHSSDWRWMLDREDSPWYPSMRLFRQARHDSWEECLAQLNDAFGAWVKTNIEKLN